MIIENWVKIIGWDRYSISDLGFIRNDDTGKILKACRNSRGYYIVVLSSEVGKRTLSLHVLVAIHHVPNPENKKQVNHLYGKEDNRAKSLEWNTQSENMLYAYKTGQQKPSEIQKRAVAEYCKNNYSKKVIQKDMQNNIIAEYYSTSEASRITGFCQTHICSCCRGKVKTCHNFKFEYA